MSKFLASVLCAVLCGSAVLSIPLNARSPTATTPDAVQPSPTVPYASDDPNYPLWNEHTTAIPQPERGQLGGTILGPQNIAIDRQNPDILAPPTTDSGTVYVVSADACRS